MNASAGTSAPLLQAPYRQLVTAAAPLTDPAWQMVKATKFDAGSLTMPSTNDFLAALGM